MRHVALILNAYYRTKMDNNTIFGRKDGGLLKFTLLKGNTESGSSHKDAIDRSAECSTGWQGHWQRLERSYGMLFSSIKITERILILRASGKQQ